MIITSPILAPSDAELLAAFARSRSSDAFRTLADRHAPWVFAAAFRQLGDRHLAEDAAQAVFLLLAQKAHAMSEPQRQKLTGWLFNALHFTLQNLKRARIRQQKHERNAALSEIAPISEQPSTADLAALTTTLDTAVAQLSESDRLAILLRFYQNRDYPDIARALQTTEPTARKRLTRAIARLRRSLGHSAIPDTSLSLLATHGLSQVPASLTTTIAHTATLTAPSGGAIVFGGNLLMTMTKLKTAALLTVVILAVAVPTFIFSRQTPSQASAPVAVPNTSSDTEPKPLQADSDQLPDAALAAYTPAAGQAVKFVTDEPPEIRSYIYNTLNDAKKRRTSNPEGLMLLSWQGGRPYFQSEYKRGPWPVRSFLKTLCVLIFDVYPQQIEGLSSIPDTTFEFSDDVVLSDVSPDQAIPQIESIFQSKFNLPLKLSFQNGPNKVIVFKGQWNYTPADELLPAVKPVIEIFNKDITVSFGNIKNLPTGNAQDLGLAIGQFLKREVIFECPNMPSSIQYQFSDLAPDAAATAAILTHITEQTGLTWSEETRTVRRLVIALKPPVTTTSH